jgi:hypothetical protein
MIIAGDMQLRAELDDAPSANAIAGILPITAVPNVWGDEFYFAIPLSLELDATAATVVPVGTIGYWPPGNALAIFFGPTPMSTGSEPVAASEVNVVGRILGDAARLRTVKHVRQIKIEKT